MLCYVHFPKKDESLGRENDEIREFCCEFSSSSRNSFVSSLVISHVSSLVSSLLISHDSSLVNSPLLPGVLSGVLL